MNGKPEPIKKFANDRHGSIVIYPDGARDPVAIAKAIAKKNLGTSEDVNIEEIFPHILPNNQTVLIAIYPWSKK